MNIFDDIRPESFYGEMSEDDRFYFPVVDEIPENCDLCGEVVADREIYYERTYQGVVKRFKEKVCSKCLEADPEYFLNKHVIKIANL